MRLDFALELAVDSWFALFFVFSAAFDTHAFFFISSSIFQRDPKSLGINQQAPYFSLFLDCVFQLLEQDYCAFEFNQNFLFSLFDNANSCRFGLFLSLRASPSTFFLFTSLMQRKIFLVLVGCLCRNVSLRLCSRA